MIKNEEEYVEALHKLYVQFYFNTTFYETPDGNTTISYEDFMTLMDMCLYIERGQ